MITNNQKNANTLILTPQGHLLFVCEPDTSLLVDELYSRLFRAFSQGMGSGLLHLGSVEVGSSMPAVFAWWREFGALYLTQLCATLGAAEENVVMAHPTAQKLEELIVNAPPMTGLEYLTVEVLIVLWDELGQAFRVALNAAQKPLQDFIKTLHPAWNRIGRVHFNLAENRRDTEFPFAFIATYSSQLSIQGKVQHQPLSQALNEFSGDQSRTRLLSLLMPVQRACEQCDWLKKLVNSGDIYHPLRWTALEAYQFLMAVPQFESAGVVVRAPSAWGAGRPLRPVVKASLGTRAPSVLGKDALLDFSINMTLGDEPLTLVELKELLKANNGLQLIRGHWVEVDHEKLTRMLKRFERIEKIAEAQGGVTFSESMRLLAGASLDEGLETREAGWSEVVAGSWLADTLRGLRSPEELSDALPGAELKAQLRPYQQAGVRWLYFLTRLGLGACLADDMGLGKTIQVLSLLLLLKRDHGQKPNYPSLLIAPASLLANWVAEIARFSPSLTVLIAHPSALSGVKLQGIEQEYIEKYDLIITSYGTLMRLPILEKISWQIVIVDEAQAIKNAGTKQTKQVKKMVAKSRIALTGTPVENRLSDLWSIFDFTHPGLLGSDKVFAKFVKRLTENEHFGPLRELVRPYILRRLKTDKRVINDLPDKTELKVFCHLSPLQAALYHQAVTEMVLALNDAQGIGRKGVVLSFLMRFKQLCNHPSQWQGDAAWNVVDSGKFMRLRELAEVIAVKQEKLLIFTQFREMTEPLAAFLGTIFGREGLVLHGGTPVAKRRAMVERFQADELIPFFVLSLKAGGSGLNLTAASHVIHFDRWWNPAVENQATDRAFRIGQMRNVLVHKFVCRGTVEDKIDQLIESKQSLVEDVLEGGAELLLTEMSDQALLDLVKLDIYAAQDN
ncbi:MAG: DEAD/DEAH box helicase [Ferrovum sp.]|nr:DEAD/DEAH box helicase [Ferrovum sp.]